MIEKFQASLLGFAIGDAMGAVNEDLLPEPGELTKRVTYYVKAGPAHPLSHVEPGCYSDETQTMLCTAESLVASKGFKLEDIIHRLVDWFHSQKSRSSWRFPGNTTMKACRKLAGGTHWTASGFPSAGIGAVVRSVPLCLVFWRSFPLLKDSLEKCCKITHTDPKVMASAMIMATTIRLGFEGCEPAPDPIINAAIEKAQMYSPDVTKRLKQVKDCLKMEIEPALQTLGTSGFCYDAISTALFLFLRFPRRFDDLVVETANCGGDSDSIGALAGAMFGAFNGLAAISDRWLKPLENGDKIKQLGCDLYRLATPQR